MANEIIGAIVCPHCGNQAATVHAQARGGKLYYRCYESPGSIVSRCGTVQITGPAGQQWIKASMKSIAEPKGSEQPPERPQIAKGSEPLKKSAGIGSILSNFWSEE